MLILTSYEKNKIKITFLHKINALYILRIYLSKEKSHEKHHPSNVVCALIEIFFEILLH